MPPHFAQLPTLQLARDLLEAFFDMPKVAFHLFEQIEHQPEAFPDFDLVEPGDHSLAPYRLDLLRDSRALVLRVRDALRRIIGSFHHQLLERFHRKAHPRLRAHESFLGRHHAVEESERRLGR